MLGVGEWMIFRGSACNPGFVLSLFFVGGREHVIEKGKQYNRIGWMTCSAVEGVGV